LIIGSAAGIAVMGILNIDFIWYLRRMSLLALAGYIGGAVAYWLLNTFGIGFFTSSKSLFYENILYYPSISSHQDTVVPVGHQRYHNIILIKS